MKKNLLASLALVFAAAFVLADGNLGTPTKVGSLSRSSDYVYKADEVDAIVTSRAYVHPAHTARTGKPAANQTPAFGGSFTVSQVLSDGQGHVTNLVDRTIAIPSTAATTSAAGLMSAADKTALDSLSSGAVTKAAVTAALQAQGIASTDSMDDMDTLAAKVAAIIAVLEALD